MINSLLGTKQKMGATYVSDTRVAVTWVKVGPCVVTQIKKMDKDGYFGVQLGFDEKKAKNTSKPLQGHLKKSQKPEGKEKQTTHKFPRYVKEIRLTQESNLKVGDVVKLTDVFKKGDVVAVRGTSKGKGFAGVVKRWGFAGGPKTHGQSDRHRAPGSIGQRTDPGRVWKGKKMSGRMGTDTIYVKNLIVADINEEDGTLAISGGLPGPTGNLLVIEKLASGKLEELVEETPVAQVVQGEASEAEAAEGKESTDTEGKAEADVKEQSKE